MKFFIILFLVAGIFLIPNSFFDTYGLSCAPPNLSNSVEETEIVFSGKVISVENTLNYNEQLVPTKTLFSVTEPFKGIYEKEVKIHSDETWGPWFEEGKEYLIFADSHNGLIQAQLCSPIDLVEHSDIELVRELVQDPSKKQFENCVLGNYHKDFGLGEWTTILHNQENEFCVMNISWKAEADSIEYFCKVPVPELKNSDWKISSHPLNEMTGFCTVIKFNSLISPSTDFVMSPKKQFNLGLDSQEILCKENLVLIQKYDGSPACVKSTSLEKLIEHGWAKP